MALPISSTGRSHTVYTGRGSSPVVATAPQIFQDALINLEQLQIDGLVKGDQLEICKKVREEVMRLAAIAERSALQFKEEGERIEKQLVKLHEEGAELTRREGALVEGCRTLETQLASFQSRKISLGIEKETLSEEIREVEKQIRDLGHQADMARFSAMRFEEQHNLAKLPPYLAVARHAEAGAREYERYMSMAGAARGMQVGFETRLERLNKEWVSLNEKIFRVEEELTNRRKILSQVQLQLKRIEGERDQIDRKVKECGANMTQMENIALRLKELGNKYRFIGAEIETMRDAIDFDLLDRDQVKQVREDLSCIYGSEIVQKYLLN